MSHCEFDTLQTLYILVSGGQRSRLCRSVEMVAWVMCMYIWLSGGPSVHTSGRKWWALAWGGSVIGRHWHGREGEICGEKTWPGIFFWENQKKYYCISCHSLMLICRRVLKVATKEDENMCIEYNQYRCCWWPGDTRSQGISCYGIDLVYPEYSGPRTRRVLKS